MEEQPLPKQDLLQGEIKIGKGACSLFTEGGPAKSVDISTGTVNNKGVVFY